MGIVIKKKKCKLCEEQQYLYARGMCKTCDAKENPDKHGGTLRTERWVGEKPNIYKDGTHTIATHMVPYNPPRKPRKRIPVRSEKQKIRIQSYGPVRKEFLAEHPRCEAKLENCLGAADQIHHKKGKIGKLLFDDRYFLAVCGKCHRWIEDNPDEAKEQKFSLNRITND